MGCNCGSKNRRTREVQTPTEMSVARQAALGNSIPTPAAPAPAPAPLAPATKEVKR